MKVKLIVDKSRVPSVWAEGETIFSVAGSHEQAKANAQARMKRNGVMGGDGSGWYPASKDEYGVREPESGIDAVHEYFDRKRWEARRK